MSDTQEDVRHHLDCPKCGRRVRGHKVYVTGNADHRDDGHFRICPKCNTRFREVKPPDKRLTRLAAYEALGSVEYLAALVDGAKTVAVRCRENICEHDADDRWAEDEEGPCECDCGRCDIFVLVKLLEGDRLPHHDEAERLREGTCEQT